MGCVETQRVPKKGHLRKDQGISSRRCSNAHGKSLFGELIG